jgi:hypothetical protein
MSQQNPVTVHKDRARLATEAAGYSVFYGYDNRRLQASARFGSPRGSGLRINMTGSAG